MITVASVLRAGGKVGYDAEWVHRLQRAVKRNLTLPHRFVCISDCEVECERIPLDSVGQGFWAKMQLFRPGVLTGPVLYFDLDTVICQNIDHMVTKLHDHDFVMWYEADRAIHSSAMMWWQNNYSSIWGLYRSQPSGYWESLYSSPPLYGDQALISEHTKHTLFTDHFDPAWFHIAGRRDHDRDLSRIKILHFRKTSSKPSTMPDHPLVKQHWI